MKHPLYSHPIDDTCPYCGSENVRNDLDEFYPLTHDCEITVECDDCERTHRLKYRLDTLILEGENHEEHEFYAGTLIHDQFNDGKDTTLVAVVVDASGISIMAQGYGDQCSAIGYGSPVLLERYEGNLRVVVWPNINNEEETVALDLGGAKLTERVADPDYPYAVQTLTPNGAVVSQYEFRSQEEAAEYKAKLPGGFRSEVKQL